MASDVEFERGKHKQVINLSEIMEKHNEKYNYTRDYHTDSRPMRDRKPSRELYKPKATRLNRPLKSGEAVNVYETNLLSSGNASGLLRDKSDLFSNICNEQDDDKPKKVKRPDQLIYVPKARAAALAGQDKELPPNTSSSSQDKDADSSCVSVPSNDKKELPKNSKRYSVSTMRRNRTVSCSSDGSGSAVNGRRSSANSLSSSPHENVSSQEHKKQCNSFSGSRGSRNLNNQHCMTESYHDSYYRYTKSNENSKTSHNSHWLENCKNVVNNRKHYILEKDFYKENPSVENAKIISSDSRKHNFIGNQKFDRKSPDKKVTCTKEPMFSLLTNVGPRRNCNEKWGRNKEDSRQINDFNKRDQKRKKITRFGKQGLWEKNNFKIEATNGDFKTVKPFQSDGYVEQDLKYHNSVLRNGVPSPVHYWDDDEEDTVIPTTVIVNKKFVRIQDKACDKLLENKKNDLDLIQCKSEEKNNYDSNAKLKKEKQKNMENLKRGTQGILNYSAQENTKSKDKSRREWSRQVSQEERNYSEEKSRKKNTDSNAETNQEKSSSSTHSKEQCTNKRDSFSLSEVTFTKDWSEEVVEEEYQYRKPKILNRNKPTRPEGECDTPKKLDVNIDRGPELHSPKGGGIIRLPPDSMPNCHSETQLSATDSRDSRLRSSRNVGHWHLYDPHNSHESPPPPALTFHDPEAFSLHPYYDRLSDVDIRSVKSYHMPNHFSRSHYADYYYPQGAPYHEYFGYYPGDQDSASNPSTGTTLIIDGILREIVALETLLSNILSRRFNGEEFLQKINQLRQEIQIKFVEAIFLDISYCNEKNVEQAMWKSAFYQVIEAFRRQMSDGDDSAFLKERLLNFLEEASAFYEDLLDKLQKSYGFVLADYLDSEALRPEGIRRSVKLALLSAQRCMISLGDIARYREQTNETSNYGKARSWYMKAQQIAPKNGRPYNQLAILALYTKRKLDAVYYYTRSLAASNPFLTARESLMSLFDDARKKAEHGEKKRLAEHYEQLAKKELRIKRHSERREIWISPDGISSEQHLPDSEEDDEDMYLSKLSSVELNKRFVLSFLNCHGKLFTKIGMETFPEICSGLLKEFRALLQHYPLPLGNLRLLQLMAINMFAVENTASKVSLEENSRPLLQEQALQLGLDMYGLVVECCIDLFKNHMGSSKFPTQLMSEDLQQVFPSIKVWSDWMMCHKDLLNPPPSQHHLSLGPHIDVWSSVAELMNILFSIDQKPYGLHDTKKENDETIILPEDTMLAGFVPLLSISPPIVYIYPSIDKELARDCLRIQRLLFFADCWCGIDPPLLTFQVDIKKYIPVMTSPKSDSQSKTPSDYESETENQDDVVVEAYTEDEDNSNKEDNLEEGSEIEHLKQRKEELEKKKAQQEHHKKQYQAVLKQQRTCPIEIEINPTFLVPDTNCFIDHLAHIKNLAECKKFTVVIPLIVINELHGLARGSREGQYDSVEHAQMVATGAKQAMTYLEERFSLKDSHIRALTSKGSLLETIAFRSEDIESSNGNNDDLILACCFHFCDDKEQEPQTDGPTRLHRNVVLLTDDRNLRLKAHTFNVPVRNVPAFLRWLQMFPV